MRTVAFYSIVLQKTRFDARSARSRAAGKGSVIFVKRKISEAVRPRRQWILGLLLTACLAVSQFKVCDIETHGKESAPLTKRSINFA